MARFWTPTGSNPPWKRAAEMPLVPPAKRHASMLSWDHRPSVVRGLRVRPSQPEGSRRPSRPFLVAGQPSPAVTAQGSTWSQRPSLTFAAGRPSREAAAQRPPWKSDLAGCWLLRPSLGSSPVGRLAPAVVHRQASRVHGFTSMWRPSPVLLGQRPSLKACAAEGSPLRSVGQRPSLPANVQGQLSSPGFKESPGTRRQSVPCFSACGLLQWFNCTRRHLCTQRAAQCSLVEIAMGSKSWTAPRRHSDSRSAGESPPRRNSCNMFEQAALAAIQEPCLHSSGSRCRGE